MHLDHYVVILWGDACKLLDRLNECQPDSITRKKRWQFNLRRCCGSRLLNFLHSCAVNGIHRMLNILKIFHSRKRPNFYYATGGSFIEMRFQSDSAIRNQFIINQTLA